MQPAKGSLLPVIIAVEFTDLLFAVDSIPAVLGVSHNPFVVYTSNIAAVLGLRSLYFALSAMLDRFRYLHYGLGALLGLCRTQNAHRPLDRSPDHDFARGHRRHPRRLRCCILDCFFTAAGNRQNRIDPHRQQKRRKSPRNSK